MPEAQSSSARVTFGDAGHIALPGTSSLPNLTTARRALTSSRDANDVSGSATERSESSEAWSEERVRQLEEDKAAIERLWGEHAQENDIGVLKFKLVRASAVLRSILPEKTASSRHVGSRHPLHELPKPSLYWVRLNKQHKNSHQKCTACGGCV